jgi:hypothetical protein
MTLQHLRSSTANKRPLPGSMSDGQLAINTNTSSPGLFFKDSAGALVKVGPVHVGSTAPNASPASGGTAGNTVGEQWLDTSNSTYVFKIWDGSAWRSEAGEFVNTTGDVMTGALGIIAGSAGSPGLYVSGDTNTGIYSPGADQVSVATGGTERLRIDAAGQIEANGLGSAAAPAYSWIGDPNTGIYSPGADQVAISTNGTERMRLDSSGRLGLGTSSPQLPFTIGAGGGANPATSGSTQSSGGIARLGSSGAATLDVGILAAGPVWLQATNVTNLATNYSLLLNPNGGNVGIGTTSPRATLDVAAASHTAAYLGGTGNYSLRLGHNNTDAEITSINAGTAFTNLAFNSLNAIFATGSGSLTERARIDSSGRLLVGTSSAYQVESGFSQTSQQIVGGDPLALLRYQAGAGHVTSWFCKSRNATVGQHTVLQDNDGIARFNFQGSDGTNFVTAARIDVAVDGTPGTNDMPGRIVFSTTADGASSPTERMRITSAGVLQVADAGNISVGTTTGTKIGTATTQKLGFYNATPVVQPTAVADATDAASVITQLNALLTRMRNLGLIAT